VTASHDIVMVTVIGYMQGIVLDRYSLGMSSLPIKSEISIRTRTTWSNKAFRISYEPNFHFGKTGLDCRKSCSDLETVQKGEERKYTDEG